MNRNSPPVLPKWPFYLGDGLLVLTAIILAFQSTGPLGAMEFFWCIFAIALGAAFFITPFVLEYKAAVDLHALEQAQHASDNTPNSVDLETIEAIQRRLQQTIEESFEITKQFEEKLLNFEDKIEELHTNENSIDELTDHLNPEETQAAEVPPPSLSQGPPPDETRPPFSPRVFSDNMLEVEVEAPKEEKKKAIKLTKKQAFEQKDDQLNLFKEDQETTLIVEANIGTGNNLFIRGEGPGLSWEEGIAMDYVDMGTWQWKTNRARDTIMFRVFKNDDVPAEGETLSILPGQTVEIYPDFASTSYYEEEN